MTKDSDVPMVLTASERKRLARATAFIEQAQRATELVVACHAVNEAEDLLRLVGREIMWAQAWDTPPLKLET